MKLFKGTKCLVTGGLGMIGNKVIEILAEAGALLFHADIKYSHDLRNFELCKQLTASMDYVFHIAGIKGSPKVTKEFPADFFVPMLQMNTNILEASRLNDVKGVVYVSSIGAYSEAPILYEHNWPDEPMDYYPGWAKRMGEFQIETYMIQYGLDNFSIVRPANVYGEKDRFDSETGMVIPSLMAKIARGDNPVVIWGDGSEIRDFVYAGDVAKGIVQAMEYGTKGQFVNLGSGRKTSIKELVEVLRSFIEFNYEFDVSKRAGYPKRVMDISLAKEMIHYNPTTTLEEGLRKTWKWYQQI